jgi:MFS family permease
MPGKSNKTSFYYGWVIVGILAVANAVGMGMATLNIGLYIKPMGDELGIGRASFGWASTVRSMSSAVTSPILGNLIDKYGVRWILAIGTIITGSCMIGMAYVTLSWQLIIIFSIMGLVGLAGPGALVTSIPPSKWFIRNRGKALAITAIGISAGAAIFIPLTQIFISTYSWQKAWVILGVSGMIILAPLSDGDSHQSNNYHDIQTNTEHSFTLRDAIKTPSMWLLTLAFSILTLGILTFALHRIPAFMDRGLDPTSVSIATAFDAVCAGIGSFSGGMLVKKFSTKVIGSAAFLLLSIASVMTIYAYDFWLMFISMALFGLGIGVNGFTQNYIWAEYFGRKHLGNIRGFVTPINLVLGGIGAPIAGYVLDSTGSYDPAWWAAVALMILASIIFYLSEKPIPKT